MLVICLHSSVQLLLYIYIYIQCAKAQSPPPRCTSFALSYAPTDYIYGGGQGCQNDAQVPQNSKKMNPARLVWRFIFIEFYIARAAFWCGPRVPKCCQAPQKGAKMMPREAKKSRKWTQVHPKGHQWEKRRLLERFSHIFPLHLDTHFATFSPKYERKWQRGGLFWET